MQESLDFQYVGANLGEGTLEVLAAVLIWVNGYSLDT